MIKDITIITSTLMILASYASAEFSGHMDCKVKSNKVMGIEEGLPKEFTGFTDQFVVGDNLTLTYGFENAVEAFLKIKDNKRTNSHYHLESRLDRLWYDTWEGVDDGAGFKSPANRLYLTPDWMRSESLFQYYLTLNRYYKNDWEGMIINRESNLVVQVTTLDCRHKIDQLEQMIEYMDRQNLIREQKAAQNKKSPYLSYEDIIALGKIDREELAKQLNEANKKIVELEAAQK